MEFHRKRMFDALTTARECGPYDELPVLRKDIDPQIHLSRNDRPQPFFLISALDSMLVNLVGEGTVELRGSSVNSFSLVPGDLVYVPAGTPHRLVPTTESVMLRHKALEPTLEGVAWFCASCDAEVHRDEFDTAKELPQEGYWRACNEFNAKAELRSCPSCGTEHPPADLTGIRWPEVAEAIRAAD